jgi:Ras family protein A
MYENFVVDTEVDGQPVQVALWWVAAHEEYERLRPLSYLDSDVVLICFAIDDPESFENVTSKVSRQFPFKVDVIVVSRSAAIL